MDILARAIIESDFGSHLAGNSLLDCIAMKNSTYFVVSEVIKNPDKITDFFPTN